MYVKKKRLNFIKILEHGTNYSLNEFLKKNTNWVHSKFYSFGITSFYGKLKFLDYD